MRISATAGLFRAPSDRSDDRIRAVFRIVVLIWPVRSDDKLHDLLEQYAVPVAAAAGRLEEPM